MTMQTFITMRNLEHDFTFIGIDEGNQRLFKGCTSAPELHWVRSLAEFPTARSLHRFDGDTIMVGYSRGCFLCDINTGAVKSKVDQWNNVTAAIPLENGSTLIAGQDLEGRKGISLITLDPSDKVIHGTSFPGDYIRLVSKTPQQTYLLCMNDQIQERSVDLELLQTFRAPGFLHAWKAERQADGTTLVSGGYGATLVRFSATAEILVTMGGKDSLPPEVEPNFFASFDIGPDKTLVVANWQGHGPGNGKKGRQLVCFDQNGSFITSWSWPREISSFQGFMII
jgi:hypothetical protein